MAEKILQRIDGVLKHIDFILKEIKGVSLQDFRERRLLPEAICFSLAQIGERMNKLEELIGAKYPSLPWKQARKMRNIIVHDYDGVDFEKVYFTAVGDLPPLKESLIRVKKDIKDAHERTIEITTKRLLLRPWDDFDVDELFELAKDPDVLNWCGGKPQKTIGDALFVLHNFLEVDNCFAICSKENEKVMGSTCLLPSKDNKEGVICEVNYWIGKPFRKRGYAQETVEAMMHHAFVDLGASILVAKPLMKNETARRLQEKLGFLPFDLNRDAKEQCQNGQECSYGLTKETWLARKRSMPEKNSF